MAFRFRFLENIALADIAFEVEGDSVEELFHGCTQALLEIMADPSTVAASWERRIVKTYATLDDLLVEWLSEILYWNDAADVVFYEHPLNSKCENDGLKVDAKLLGSTVDQAFQTLSKAL